MKTSLPFCAFAIVTLSYATSAVHAVEKPAAQAAPAFPIAQKVEPYALPRSSGLELVHVGQQYRLLLPYDVVSVTYKDGDIAMPVALGP
ncbi:hypothetical protein EON80_28160, partial [bacterium]